MIDWIARAPEEPELVLNGTRVPIAVRRHPRARRLTLRLAPDGSEVRITLPRWARTGEAIAFAHARRDWLANQHAAIPQRIAPQPGGTIRFRGSELRLDWQSDRPRRPALSGDSLLLGGPQDTLEPRARRWLENEALALMEADAEHYTATAGLSPVSVALSRAQKRWGSCSDARRLRINWRLVQAPDFVRRSVVAHEVAHLVHFDHSPAFHALLAQIYEDDIGRADAWLKAHGRTLYVTFG
ncbi:MAG: SprT family zinc-dependent metalloprotease [Erythrobacter sp.]|uniref:M48 family metallopeptidase n=1 Tax=Erythrobacter sp. TaxID=1042 RepID=UPI003C77D6D5